MAVRSDRLFGPTLLPAGSFTALCEIPAGQVWLLKTLRFVSISPDSVSFDVRLDPADVTTSLFCETALGGRGIVIDTTWQVLDEGDELFGRASAEGSAVVWGSGAKLVL